MFKCYVLKNDPLLFLSLPTEYHSCLEQLRLYSHEYETFPGQRCYHCRRKIARQHKNKFSGNEEKRVQDEKKNCYYHYFLLQYFKHHHHHHFMYTCTCHLQNWSWNEDYQSFIDSIGWTRTQMETKTNKLTSHVVYTSIILSNEFVFTGCLA